MKHREIYLYKWKLFKRTKPGETYHSPPMNPFVVDRGDNKRRKTSELKSLLMELNQIPADDSKQYDIGGYDGFRGYAISFGCNP